MVAQPDAPKYYYKDTTMNFYGYVIKTSQTVATNEVFKSLITITNTTDDFMIIHPNEIFGIVNPPYKTSCVNRNDIVIPPQYTKKFRLKFVGQDFRSPSLIIDISKVKFTDQPGTSYKIPEINIYKQRTFTAGPIEWTLVNFGDHDPEDNFRVIATIKYTGNKFLGLLNNNVSMSTAGGKTYVNLARQVGKYHYDSKKPEFKLAYYFPIETKKIGTTSAPTLNFDGVFVEYSLSTAMGFKIAFSRGKLADFKGKNSTTEDKDIEEAE
jgi:hypothetical protein